jgi:hypothetical protein
MKTLKVLFIALLFAGCSAEEVVEPQGNTCIKSYYVYKPIAYQGGTWVWDYVFQYSEATTLPATNGYVLINNSNYYTVSCD